MVGQDRPRKYMDKIPDLKEDKSCFIEKLKEKFWNIQTHIELSSLQLSLLGLLAKIKV